MIGYHDKISEAYYALCRRPSEIFGEFWRKWGAILGHGEKDMWQGEKDMWQGEKDMLQGEKDRGQGEKNQAWLLAQSAQSQAQDWRMMQKIGYDGAKMGLLDPTLTRKEKLQEL